MSVSCAYAEVCILRNDNRAAVVVVRATRVVFLRNGTREFAARELRESTHRVLALVTDANPRVDHLLTRRDTRAIQQVGKYQLGRLLAVGGMAEIYLARETGIAGFERWVVIKRILPQFEADAEFVRMFLDEARLAATLQHPNVVQVFAVDEHEGLHYLAMEYLHGYDLGRVLTRASAAKRRLPLEQALTIVHGAAAGLHHAHESRGIDGKPNGVVHRDVSPGNIVITFDGSVKLVDFGIAKAIARGTKTAEGTIKGKVSYMSPEQCRGRAIDRRSDIFSLGIVLWELTTGRKLFKGASEFMIANQLLNEEIPRPSSRVDNYPPALEALVMRMLGSDPDDRPATTRQVQLDIEELARDRRMSLSPIGLAAYMTELFGDDRGPWEEIASESSSPAATPIVTSSTVAMRAGRPARRGKLLFVAPVAAVALGAIGWTVYAGLDGSSTSAAAIPAPSTPEPTPTPKQESKPMPIVESKPAVVESKPAVAESKPAVENKPTDPPAVIAPPRAASVRKRTTIARPKSEPPKAEALTVDPAVEREQLEAKRRADAERKQKELEQKYFGDRKERTP